MRPPAACGRGTPVVLLRALHQSGKPLTRIFLKRALLTWFSKKIPWGVILVRVRFPPWLLLRLR
jgi:hypothetical protein